VIPPARPGGRATEHERVQIAIVLFDSFAAIDAATAHAAALTLDRADVVFTASAPGPIRDESRRVELTANAALVEVPRPDLLIVPGGAGALSAGRGGAIEAWIAAADRAGSRLLTIGAGALFGAEAGVLADLPVAAPGALHDRLSALGATPVPQPIAVADRVASSRAAIHAAYVTAALAARTSPSKGI
jgi:transcriptional regulator GlxA family with amidase domain